MSQPFHYCPACRSHKLAQICTGAIGCRNSFQCPDCGHMSKHAANWQHDTEAPTPAQLKRRQITLNLGE